ncbi:MAG: hypothetical protein WAN35_17390 [Terracidiphilus sp.]
MNTLAVLKRVLLATAGVIAMLGIARPAAAAPFYFYTITAVPNWGAGNPQPLAGWSAVTALAPGAPLQAENYVSLSLLTIPGFWYAYDTFLGESNGFIGADVSIPTAQWVTPAAYIWAGGPGPVFGGGLAFFNSFNPFTGVFFANMMIVGDPAGCDATCALGDFETDLGSTSGSLTPSLVTLDGNGDPVGVTLPNDDEDPSVAPDPNGTDYFASGSQEVDTPEGSTAIYLLFGISLLGAALFLRRLGAKPLTCQ